MTYECNNCSHSTLEDRNEKLTKETLSIDADDWICDISVGVGEHLLNTMIVKTVKGKILKINENSAAKRIVEKQDRKPNVVGFYGKTSKNGIIGIGAYYILKEQGDWNPFMDIVKA